MKKLTVLGSTGSIGTQTLEVVRNRPEKFSVVGMCCGKNTELLFEQIKEFRPQAVGVSDEKLADELNKRIRLELPDCKTEVYGGDDAADKIAVLEDADIAVGGMVGFAGLRPVYKAIMAGKDIALANKETLVAGGDIVMPLAKEMNVQILPVDSEHSAIWQCLKGNKDNELDRILITASGGPFRGWNRDQLKSVTREKALNHPTWKMGGKVTIDSSTMMNKGLEIIEAHHLFGVEADRIDVVVHPQSVVHSMVRFIDGSVIGQIGKPSMIMPITVALNYPDRCEGFLEKFDPFAPYASTLTFEKCDTKVFRLLDLAYEAGKMGGIVPACMNAANEVAVNAFLEGRIEYLDIEKTVYEVCDYYFGNREEKNLSLDIITEADFEARQRAAELIR